MAKACACDRCGKFYVPKNGGDRSKNRYLIHDCENPCNRWNSDFLDLCNECYAELDEFMNAPRNSQTL